MVDILKMKELGFSQNESLVYVALLQIGETKTGAIIKKTKLHRMLVYDALDSLINKGLATYCIKENRKYFTPANPETILRFIDEKRSQAEQLIPQLKVLTKEQNAQSVVIYESVRGIKSVILRMLDELNSKSFHVCFASGQMYDQLGPAFYKLYQEEKGKKKIKTRILFDSTFKNKNVLNVTTGLVGYYALGPFPTDTWVYNDKVLIVNFSCAVPFAILVTSKESAQRHLSQFESFWKTRII